MSATEENLTPIEKFVENNKVEKRRRKQKKRFINEDLFGKSRTFEDTDPEEGIAHLKIRPHELGNIPGLIEHWGMEIKHRVDEIHAWKEKTFLQRVVAQLQGPLLSDAASGMEIAKFHPSRGALRKVKRLKRNPANMMNRLELVSIVAKSGREFPIEAYRAFLLQAVVACSLREYSTLGLMMAIWVQDHYFTKLYYLCQREVQALESKLELEIGKDNVFTRQAQGLRQHINNVKRNMEIIQSFQKQSAKVLQENSSSFNTILSLEELTEFVLSVGSQTSENDQKRADKQTNILRRASQILLLLRVVPLLYPEAEKISSLLKKMDQNDPVAHFLEGKVNMSDLIFKVGMYQGGERSAKIREEIQKAFQKVLHHYGVAVKKVGKLPRGKLEFTILIEYASLIHYFYKVTKSTLGIHVPREWLKSVFVKAIHLLSLTQEKGQTEELMRDLYQDMSDEGMEDSISHSQNR